jgi:hypothetical protein
MYVTNGIKAGDININEMSRPEAIALLEALEWAQERWSGYLDMLLKEIGPTPVEEIETFSLQRKMYFEQQLRSSAALARQIREALKR